MNRTANRAYTDLCDRPMADHGWLSYRARGRYGWIMIGASDDADAMLEALRSTAAPTDLQVWDGTAYVPCAQVLP